MTFDLLWVWLCVQIWKQYQKWTFQSFFTAYHCGEQGNSFCLASGREREALQACSCKLCRTLYFYWHAVLFPSNGSSGVCCDLPPCLGGAVHVELHALNMNGVSLWLEEPVHHLEGLLAHGQAALDTPNDQAFCPTSSPDRCPGSPCTK